ncbi:MAG TPA: hypothetical protein VHS34_19815 [Terriglobales bacterium]|jgi:hypothetical protein|nr:hypothetical protein [Terriglobales bacterium]
MRPAERRKVRIYDACDVDYEVVNLSTESRDEVEWHSTGPAFSIEFDSSPFAEDCFEVPAGGCVSSGPVVKDTPYARFHYRIQNRADLAMSADPDVDVRK